MGETSDDAVGQEHQVDLPERVLGAVEGGHVVGHQPQPDAGGELAHDADQRRADGDDSVVRGDDLELPLRRGRVELGDAGEDPLGTRQGGGHQWAELRGQRSEFVAVACSHEQVIDEVPAQPGQRSGHGRLSETQTFGGPRHTPFGEQHVERDHEIQVEAAQPHQLRVSIRDRGRSARLSLDPSTSCSMGGP